MLDPCNCVYSHRLARHVDIHRSNMHFETQRAHKPSCSPTLQQRGILFTQWVSERHEPRDPSQKPIILRRLNVEEICSPSGWINDTSQSYVSIIQRTNHNTTVSGTDQSFTYLSPRGCEQKSPATFFKGDASQVRAWARTLQWSHQGDTVQWIKQILLALQLLHVWVRRTSISEQEGKNPLIRRLETT